MQRSYQVWVTIESSKIYGRWVEVSFNTYNHFIKDLILSNYEITTEKMGNTEFIKANDSLIASVTERSF